MDAQERFGLLMICVVGAALAAVLLVVAGPREQASAVKGCSQADAFVGTSNVQLVNREFQGDAPDVVAQLERFVCHDLAYARDARGWSFHGADGIVVELPDGSITWDARLRYTLGTYATTSARYLVLNIDRPAGEVDLWTQAAPGELDRISLRGKSAVMWRVEGDGIVVRWWQDGLRFEAEVIADDNNPTRVNQRDLVTFLSTVE